MKKILGFFLIFILTTSFHGNSGCHGFTPENDIRIPVNATATSGISEADVREIADVLYDLYAKDFQDLQRSFAFNIQWNDDSFNAYTNLYRGRAQIVITGGMIRHPLISKDGIALVLCHEIGHHLAGKPTHRFRVFFPSWAAAEGQADYFSTLKCMRKYLLTMDDNAINETDLPDSIKNQCLSSFKSKELQTLCIRSMMAGQTMATVLNSIKKEPLPNLSFENPDPTIVKKTFTKHPNPQCRLDTYLAGGICDISHTDNIDIKEDHVAQCVRRRGFTKGVRPLCWYAKI